MISDDGGLYQVEVSGVVYAGRVSMTLRAYDVLQLQLEGDITAASLVISPPFTLSHCHTVTYTMSSYLVLSCGRLIIASCYISDLCSEESFCASDPCLLWFSL